MVSKSKVYFFFQGVRLTLKNRTALKGIIGKIFRKEKRTLESINYVFCSDKSLLEINRKYLKHDFYTDIITFDLSEKEKIIADVYISVDRVKDNASSLDVSFRSELHRVIFHGALHLCGYGDKTESQKLKMRDREDYYINLYFKRK